MTLLIQFFLAHIVGDFFLQREKWVKEKEQRKLRSWFLYAHTAIHFVLLILITGNIAFWKAGHPFLWKQALIITVLHFIIDAVKLVLQQEKTKRQWFFIDQFLHLVTIIGVWGYTEKVAIDWNALSDKTVLFPVTAVLFLLFPTSFIIRNIVSRWTPTIENMANAPGQAGSAGQTAAESLKNAGQLIGMVERILVLIFILLDKWEGIGFLLAAKSVFRFGDLKEAKEMKLTEYVLIGTLFSFGIAVVIGLITTHLLA